MKPLNLPPFDSQITESDGRTMIFDVIRKKNLVLTPEEWVRQHFIHLLLNAFDYPKGLLKIEGGLTYSKLQKRSDILVYDKTGEPYFLIECKAPKVPLNKKTIAQAAIYNKTLNAPFVAITNGLKTYCFKMDFESANSTQMKSLPKAP